MIISLIIMIGKGKFDLYDDFDLMLKHPKKFFLVSKFIAILRSALFFPYVYIWIKYWIFHLIYLYDYRWDFYYLIFLIVFPIMLNLNK